MSVLERRAKSIYKIPLIDMKNNQPEVHFDDPRSPSANITRTPIELTAHNPLMIPPQIVVPVKSTR